MAKAIVLVALALLVLGFASNVESHDLELKGQVYCDPCNVYFLTKLSTFPQGARVQLVCKNQDTGVETFKTDAVTGPDGKYKIPVKSDHELDICEVKVLSNPDPDCNIIRDEIDNVKVSLTKNTGIDSTTRFANAIGFVRKAPLPGCVSELEEMGYEWINGVEPELN